MKFNKVKLSETQNDNAAACRNYCAAIIDTEYLISVDFVFFFFLFSFSSIFSYDLLCCVCCVCTVQTIEPSNLH